MEWSWVGSCPIPPLSPTRHCLWRCACLCWLLPLPRDRAREAQGCSEWSEREVFDTTSAAGLHPASVRGVARPELSRHQQRLEDMRVWGKKSDR